jgi:hypothetical protein
LGTRLSLPTTKWHCTSKRWSRPKSSGPRSLEASTCTAESNRLLYLRISTTRCSTRSSSSVVIVVHSTERLSTVWSTTNCRAIGAIHLGMWLASDCKLRVLRADHTCIDSRLMRFARTWVGLACSRPIIDRSIVAQHLRVGARVMSDFCMGIDSTPPHNPCHR